MITNVTLTTKEKYLLEDQKNSEEQCILKYDNYANLAVDAQLKAVFRSNGQKEKEHLQTINLLLNGQVPSMGGHSADIREEKQQESQQNIPKSQQSSIEQNAPCEFKASDADLCKDALTMEKYVSGAYDTAIFEFRDAQIRDVLNHIQKDEQKHGEAIFMYMESKGMYNPK